VILGEPLRGSQPGPKAPIEKACFGMWSRPAQT